MMKSKILIAFIAFISVAKIEASASSSPSSFVAFTANILGIFNDPFEFDGDYGNQANEIRQKVFDQVVAKEALAKSNKQQSAEVAQQEDTNHGPVLSELLTENLLALIQQYAKTLNISNESVQNILSFITKYKDQRIFRFLRNNPPEILKLDKILRDEAARTGKEFDYPILSSTQKLTGKTSDDLKIDLMKKVFTPEVLALTKPEAATKQAIDKLDQNYLKKFLEADAKNQDLYAFASPFGQLFFYWLYQALNLQLIAEIPQLIEGVNKVKETFAKTLGDAKARATSFKQKVIQADAKVVFVQEADATIANKLLENNDFLPLSNQNQKNGTLVFLRSDFWESNYEVIPLVEYAGYKDGAVNAVLATQKNTKQKFLLAACHGNSTKSEDGRAQIDALNQKLDKLSQEKNEKIILLIGTDANTKSKDDVALLKKLLDESGLVSTSVGPTTIKRRMVTVQHAKAGKFAVDGEDYLIVRKNQCSLINPTVGFNENKPDTTIALPNLSNQSDHYAIGALVVSTANEK